MPFSSPVAFVDPILGKAGLFLGVFRPDAAPAHAMRRSQRRVLDVITQYPGIPMERIARLCGLEVGTIAYHVDKLEKAGRINSLASGRRRLFYPGPARGDHTSGSELALLRTPAARKVARAVLDRPGAPAAELLAATDLTRRVFYHHLKMLRDAGLVRSSAPRSYRDITPADRLPALLQRLDEEDAAAQ